MTDFTLFRGRVTKPKVENMGGAVRVTLECEDYNGLFDRINVGAPDGSTFETQEDGTQVAIDPNAVAGDMISMLQAYWRDQAPIALVPDPFVGPDIDDTYILAPAPPGLPVLQWRTALTTLRAALDDMAAHVSGAVRYWIDPDTRPHWRAILPSTVPIGNGAIGTLDELAAQAYMMLWPAPPGPILMAPYALGSVTSGNVIMPMSTSLEWDYSHVRHSAYVRGSTVPGSGPSRTEQVFAYFGAGDDYIDAPGSIYEDDKDAILTWYGQMNFRPFLIAAAKIAPGSNGWRVGQTLMFTDPLLSLFDIERPIIDMPLVIQSVRGELKGAGEPIGVRITTFDVTTLVSVQSFNWTQTIEGAGRATIVLELLDQYLGLTLPVPSAFVVRPSADVEFYIPDGTLPLIEYDLEFGDMPAGALSRQLAKIPDPPPPAVIYHFNVDWADHHLPDGGSCLVTAVLSDAGDAPVRMGDVPMEWVLLQWVDEDATTPGAGYSLADDVGTTDASGKVFTTLSLAGGDSTWFTIDALALPIE